jgi:hypothetical protein
VGAPPAPAAALAALRPGRYLDAASGAAHWELTVVDVPGGMFGGTASFVDPAGTSTQLFQYTAQGQAPGRFAMTTSNGHSDTGTYRADSLTLSACGAYLTAPAQAAVPSCTFTRR